jgi:hypothetical protein
MRGPYVQAGPWQWNHERTLLGYCWSVSVSAVYMQPYTVRDLHGSVAVIADWLCLDSVNFNW